MKVAIGWAALNDILESACELYRQKLAETDNMYEIKPLSESLEDVIRFWQAADNFDVDDELIVTIERREEKEDGTDRAN